jgi:serine/threonine protein kinase
VRLRRRDAAMSGGRARPALRALTVPAATPEAPTFRLEVEGAAAPLCNTSVSVSAPLSASGAALSLGDLQLCEVLGRGASGFVQRAVHVASGTVLALKAVAVGDAAARAQLARELGALSALSGYDALCALRGAFFVGGDGGGTAFLALEYMDGGSLSDLVRRCGPLPERALAGLAFQVLTALAALRAAHCLHRDLKPANILLASTGRAVVADFGLARGLDTSLAAAHTVMGTARYMAPERLGRDVAYAFPADVWSAGLCLWFAAVGAEPWPDAAGFVELAEAVTEAPEVPLPPGGAWSPALRALLSRCLRTAPAERLPADALLASPLFAAHGIAGAGDAARALREHLDGRAALCACCDAPAHASGYAAAVAHARGRALEDEDEDEGDVAGGDIF